jgi:plasmid stabilization system protein ParE
MKRKRSFSISALAEEDLTAIYRWYLTRANVDVAERFLASFERTCSRLLSSADP